MDSGFIPSILRSWSHQGAYADKLTADLTPEQVFQTPPGFVVMNHPAWVLCHLTVYAPMLGVMLEGGTPDDPLEHRYGRKSTPVLDPSQYPAWDEIRAAYLEEHDALVPMLTDASAKVLEAPPTIERFRTRWPRLADAVVHLMNHHESIHLGQLSAWRRVCGLPPV